MKMKSNYVILVALAASIPFVGCKPVNVPDLVRVKGNETAFVVPLSGANKTNQKSFDSIDFLESAKVATKEIEIPKRWRKTGRMYFSGEWIPTVKVITVSRTPVTREWKPEEGKGGGDGIEVESQDSIGFAVGINITARIDELDTPTFLYYYPNTSLASVMDTNIRGDVQSALSVQFGKRSLEQCKVEKNNAFEDVKQGIIDKYKEFGITITSFGLSGGLWYEDKEIQDSINAAYTAEMAVKQREQEKLSQVQENERLLSIATNQREQAEEFAKAAEAREKQVQAEVEMIKAEAFREAVAKWDGQLPKFITGGSESLLMHVPQN